MKIGENAFHDAIIKTKKKKPVYENNYSENVKTDQQKMKKFVFSSEEKEKIFTYL